MKMKFSVSTLRKLFHRGVISSSLYWKLKKIKKIRSKKLKVYQRKPFVISCFSNFECKSMFRFDKAGLTKLQNYLGIPALIKLKNKIKCTGLEGLCILLRRLCYPNRLFDLIRIFNRDPGTISRLFNFMVNLVYNKHHSKIDTLHQNWILGNLGQFAEACKASGSYFENLVGFIDGTARPICRPKYNQRDQYSGYKKQHVLKYQIITFPNGLIGRLDGPFNGKRHDAAVLRLSGALTELGQVFRTNNVEYNLYGDPGYTNQRFIKVGFKKYKKLTPLQQIFNKDMSALRVSVEYGFGKIIQQFAFLDFKKNQKLYLQPVKKMYYVAALLTNCHSCLYSNQVASYFNMPPPSLEEYLTVG